MKKNMQKIEIHTQEDLDKFKKNIPAFLKPKKCWLNTILEKIDILLFKFANNIILYLVKKEKYQKSKFEIMVYLQKINLVIFIITIFVLTPIGISLHTATIAKDSLSIIFTGRMLCIFIYLLLFLSEWIKYKSFCKKESFYRPIFALRKYPEMYAKVKILAEATFVIEKKIRLSSLKMELMWLTIFYFFIFLLFFLAPMDLGLEHSYIFYFIFSHFLLILDKYLGCIFDFDKPDGKKKKKKECMTELMKKLFKDLSKLAKPLIKPI